MSIPCFISIFLFILTLTSWNSTAKILENLIRQTEPELNYRTRAIPGAGTVSSDPKDIHFNVYFDPSNPKDFREIVVGDVSTLENSGLIPGPIIMICLPFSGASQHVDTIKDAYLKEGIKNIMMMNYSTLFKPEFPYPLGFASYVSAMNNVPLIGAKGAEFINFLVNNNQITDGGQMHLIGWSLGAHAAASIGYNLQQIYGLKVGRITGLDVAGPFNRYLKEHKFSKYSASFVDSIHSDMFGYGTPERLGHANFFINGGNGKGVTNQADCEQTDSVTLLACSHVLAVELYALTVKKSNQFIGCVCSNSMPLICVQNRKKCERPTLVGAYCPSNASGNFYVEVKRKVQFNFTAVATDGINQPT